MMWSQTPPPLVLHSVGSEHSLIRVSWWSLKTWTQQSQIFPSLSPRSHLESKLVSQVSHPGSLSSGLAERSSRLVGSDSPKTSDISQVLRRKLQRNRSCRAAVSIYIRLSECVRCQQLSVPDDDSFVHVDVDEVRAGAAVRLPVGFGVLVGQFVSSMVIGRDVHLLPALILLQLHAGTWTQHQLHQLHQLHQSPDTHKNKRWMETDLDRDSWGTRQRRGCWLADGCDDALQSDPAPSDRKQEVDTKWQEVRPEYDWFHISQLNYSLLFKSNIFNNFSKAAVLCLATQTDIYLLWDHRDALFHSF